MSDYQKPRFAKKPFSRGGGDRFGGPKQMHSANCSKCNNVCEVPFRPNGKKPVYCSNCFIKDDEPRSTYAPKREFAPRPSFSPAPARDDRGMQDLKVQMQGVNDKLTRLISLMEAAQGSVSTEAPVKKAAKKVAKKK